MLKYLLTTILCLIVNSINIYPQSTDSKSNGEQNSLQKHSWAVQFAVGSNLSIQSFDGLMFSLKYHFTKITALRFGVGIIGGSNNSTSETVHGTSPVLKDNENIYLIGSFLFFPNPKKSIVIYFGVGPRIQYKHLLDQEVYSRDTANPRFSYEERTWAVGLQLSFGAEWFPTNFLSLFAEYNPYGTYGKTRIIRTDDSFPAGNSNVDQTDWYFNGTTARLGLSVYF